MTPIAFDAPSAAPYRFVGLLVSVALILLATVVVTLAIVAAGLGLGLAALGYQHFVDKLHDLGSGGEGAAYEKLGIVMSLLAYAALSLVVLGAARLRGGPADWRALIAWSAWRPRRTPWVFALTALMIVYSLAATLTLAHFFPKFDASFHVPDGRRWTVMFLLLAAVFAPVGEEILFRGWVYTSLKASFGVAAAMIVVSVLFAVAHWEKTHLYALAVFPVGLALAFVRERTGTIKASIVVHGLYNAVAAGVMFLTP